MSKPHPLSAEREQQIRAWAVEARNLAVWDVLNRIDVVRAERETLEARVAQLEAELARLKTAVSTQNDEICQTLGQALHYPWFKDDQKNFPNATEEHGVCVGEHVAASIAVEAAMRIVDLQSEKDRLLAIVTAAHEWTAQYPLGSHADISAAEQIYNMCESLKAKS